MKLNKYQKKWLKFLATNPKKAKNVLDRGGGRRCCLGHGCAVLVKDLALEVDKDPTDGLIAYDGSTDMLPPKAGEALKIDDSGSFNDSGETFVQDFIKKNKIRKGGDAIVNNLATLNDDTNATPKQIGQIIQGLYKINAFTE